MSGVFTRSVGMKPMQDRLNWMQLKGSRRTFWNCLVPLECEPENFFSPITSLSM
jgi:hypothetical protein